MSSGLKQFSRKMIDKGYKKFVVDLADCELMDSTFMGMLTGIALHLREAGAQGDCLQVIRANERAASLLKNLGLDQLFLVRKADDPAAPPIPEEISLDQVTPAQKISMAESQKDVLEAHQALVEADAENAIRFRDVLEFLQKDADSKKSDS